MTAGTYCGRVFGLHISHNIILVFKIESTNLLANQVMDRAISAELVVGGSVFKEDCTLETSMFSGATGVFAVVDWAD